MGMNDLSVILLNNPKVQKELNLTQSQISETAESADKLAGQIVTLSFNPEYRDQPEKVQAELQKIKAQEKTLLNVLTPEQQQRLQQIFYQSLGIRLFQNPVAQKTLQLTKEQKNEIQKIIDATREKLITIISETQKSGAGIPSLEERQATRNKSDQMMKAASDQIHLLLTPNQRKQLTLMKGKPFSLYADRQRP